MAIDDKNLRADNNDVLVKNRSGRLVILNLETGEISTPQENTEENGSGNKLEDKIPQNQSSQKKTETNFVREEKKSNYKPVVEFKKVKINPPVDQTNSNKLEIDKIIQEIKQKINIFFENRIIGDRFDNIIRSYLKGIRSEIQARETLQRSIKTGGLEFSLDKIELIIKIAKEFKNKIFKQKEKKFSDEAEQGVKNFISVTPQYIYKRSSDDQAVVKLDNNFRDPVINHNQEEIKKRFEGGSIQPIFKKISEVLKTPELPKPTNIALESKRDQSYNKVVSAEDHEIKITRGQQNSQLINDINSSKYHAVGLVEELSGIKLIDLERWGGGQKVAQIILEKINLLTEESLFHRVEGIHAWQKSPLYKLYLEIGREALEKKNSIIDVINNRKTQGQPSLKIEDFVLISELNKKLKF